MIDGNIGKSEEIYNFLKLINNKYSPRILYGLLKLEFSAYTEMLKIVGTSDSRRFQASVNNLIGAGIVTPIYSDSDQYKYILKFWRKKLFRHSPGDPTFYKLNNAWIDIVESFEPIIASSFKHDPIIDQEILKRMGKYQSYCIKEKEELAKLEEEKKNSIGECISCSIIIKKTCMFGKDYHKFEKGLVCQRCFGKATPMTIVEWRK